MVSATCAGVSSPFLSGMATPRPPTVDHTVERDEQGCADPSHASPPEMLPVCTGLRILRRPTGQELIATRAWPSTNVRACGGRRVIPPHRQARSPAWAGLRRANPPPLPPRELQPAAASEPGVGSEGAATAYSAVRPAAFKSWARRPISLAAGVRRSSASKVVHISSRVRKPMEQPGRFVRMVGSSCHFLAHRSGESPWNRVTAIRYANSCWPVSRAISIRIASAHFGLHNSLK